MDKLEHFAGLLVDLEIAKQVLPILLDNGFDEWDSMVEILSHPELLTQIGITDEKTQKQILAAISVADEYEQKEENEEESKQQEEEDQQQQSETKKRRQSMEEQMLQEQEKMLMQKEMELISLEDKSYLKKIKSLQDKPITVKDLKQATMNKKSDNRGSQGYIYHNPQREEDEFLGKINVLSLNDKKFTGLGVLGKCHNVKTLHLFQNHLYRMDDQLLNLSKLTTLHLENNLIQKIENLDQCINLQKLFLNNNYIWKLEGLQNCVYLKELQISNQLQSTRKFEVCEETCKALSNNLDILELENCNLYEIPACFAYLQCIRLLKLKNNQLNTCEYFLEPMKNMNYLNELQVKGNPLAKQAKYRDKFVLMSKSLEYLDGKAILPKERQFLFNLWKKKNGMLEQKKENQGVKLPQLGKVQGQQIQFIGTEDDDYRNPKIYQKLNVGNDLRGAASMKSTKHVPNSKYYY